MYKIKIKTIVGNGFLKKFRTKLYISRPRQGLVLRTLFLVETPENLPAHFFVLGSTPSPTPSEPRPELAGVSETGCCDGGVAT